MIYPGTYRSPFTAHTKRSREHNGATTPTWEILHQNGSVLIRCWIPGAKREDIDLTIRNHRMVLSVHSSLPQQMDGSYASIRYYLDILLPERADTSWYAAEFHRGLLTLEFLQSAPQALNGESKVVVY